MMIKNLFYALAFFISISFLACSDDDDNSSSSSNSNDPLVGEWDVVEVSFTYEDTETGDIIEESFDATICDPNPTAKFNSDGSATLSSIGFDVDIDENVTCENYGIVNGTWERAGENNYPITFEEETLEIETIFSNNNNTVILRYTEEDEGEIETENMKLVRQ